MNSHSLHTGGTGWLTAGPVNLKYSLNYYPGCLTFIDTLRRPEACGCSRTVGSELVGRLHCSRDGTGTGRLLLPYAAPFHVKANNGIYVIDDFGRQRVKPVELLNRWIVPMGNRTDHLDRPPTLSPPHRGTHATNPPALATPFESGSRTSTTSGSLGTAFSEEAGERP